MIEKVISLFERLVVAVEGINENMSRVIRPIGGGKVAHLEEKTKEDPLTETTTTPEEVDEFSEGLEDTVVPDDSYEEILKQKGLPALNQFSKNHEVKKQ